MKIVVAGPGLMGSQIGCEFAIGGHGAVYLVNREDEARKRVDAAFAFAGSMGLWKESELAGGRGRIGFARSVGELDPESDVFLESIVEQAPPKIAMLAEASRRMPNAVLGSNTSSISIEVLGEGCGAPERVVGIHYWNPPLLMPLVEIISGPKTSPAIVDRAVELVKSVKKRPMRIDRDVPGFVWNRLQFALLREAVWIVENGVASAEVVDEIVQDGLARRWHHTGPFATATLGGAATFSTISGNLWPVLSKAERVADLASLLPYSPERIAEIKADRDRELLRELREEREAGS